MSLFGGTSRGVTGPIEIALEVVYDEDGAVEGLVVREVRGNTEGGKTPDGRTRLSDVEWVQEDLANTGPLDYLFDGDAKDVPKTTEKQRLLVKGKAWGESYYGMDGWDGDGGFDVESVEVIEAETENTQSKLLELVYRKLDAVPWETIKPGDYEKVLLLDTVEWNLEYQCCQDCQADRWACFMLTDELWKGLGLDGLICLECVQARMDRPLVLEDFNDAPCNHWVANYLATRDSPCFLASTLTDAVIYNGCLSLTMTTRPQWRHVKLPEVPRRTGSY